MSLSYTPSSVRPDASSRVSRKLWAATVHFARTAGSSTSAFYVSVIWAGYLYAIHGDLLSHNLVEPVCNQFVRSISDLYRLTLDDVEILSQLKHLSLGILDSLLDSHLDLKDDNDIRRFLMIAESVLPKSDDNFPEPTIDQVSEFRLALRILSNQIPSAIFDYPSGDLLLQHPDPFAPTVPPAPPVRQTSVPKASAPPKQEGGFGTFVKRLLMVLLFVGSCIGLISGALSSNEPNAAEQPSMTQVTKPRTGEILFGEEYDGSEITITADKEHDYVVTLQDKDGIHYIVFYVRAGTTVTKGVPDAKLYVHFASGTKWYGYGKGRMFGPDTYYSKDDEALDFSQSAWEYTLYPVTDGNFTESPSSEDEFF